MHAVGQRVLDLPPELYEFISPVPNSGSRPLGSGSDSSRAGGGR